MFIYLITNLINHKRYVGQTISTVTERWRQHKHLASRGKLNYPIYRAIRKYGIENFSIKQIAKVSSNNGIGWLNILEELFIKHYKTLKPNGYNVYQGGENKSHHSDTKEKIRVANKGKQFRLGHTNTQDHNAKISKALTGKKRAPFTEQAKQNMSESGKVKIFTSEHKVNLSKSLQGKKRRPMSDEHKEKIRINNIGKHGKTNV